MLTLPKVALCFCLITGVTAYSGLWEELSEKATAYVEAFNQQDLEKAALSYTEDCSVMAPGNDVFHGREGVKKLLKNVYDSGVAKITFVLEEVGPSDATDRAYQRGSWTLYDKDGNVLTKGKHIIIWKKVDGDWLGHIDVWNLNIPAGAQQMDDDTLKAELGLLDEAYCAAWKAQDFSIVGSFYTEDARLMPHEHYTIQGRKSIQKAIEGMNESGMTGADIRPEEAGYLGLSKDMAFERGYYSLLQSDGEPAEKGKYVYLWKKVEGQWKIDVDIWSSNTPPEKPRDEL